MKSCLTSVLVSCGFALACGGSPNPPPAAPRPPSEASVAVVGPVHHVPRYPLPRDRFVDQGLGDQTVATMHALSDGRVALVGSGVYAGVDGGRIVRRLALPPLERNAFRALDAAGRLLVVATAFVDLASGEVRPNPPGRRYAHCDEALELCTTVEPSTSGAWLRVRREELRSGREVDAFEIPDVLRRFEPLEEELRIERERVAVAGDTLAMAVHGERNVLLTYDMRTRAVIAFLVIGGEVRSLAFVDPAGEVGLVAGWDGISLVHMHRPGLPTRTRIDGWLAATHGSTLVVRDVVAQTERLHSRDTLEPLGEPSAPGESLVIGEASTARVTRTGVRFFDAAGAERGTASFEDAPVDPYEEEAHWTSMHLGDAGIRLWSDGLGLATIHPGDAALEYSPAVYSDGPVWLRSEEQALSLDFAAWTVSLAASGATLARHQEPRETEEDAPAEAMPLVLQRYERADAVLPGNPSLLAVAEPERRSVSFAYVRRGRVHVTDDAGHDIAPPVRLPRDVARSHCDLLSIVTDQDVVLSGSRPCIPTRIRFREGRTEPLGLARVRFVSSSDGARVALLANRRILLLDGRTGQTLLDLDPQLPHPREIAIAADGSEVHLTGEAGHVAVDLRALDASSTPPMRRYMGMSFAYTPHDSRVVLCENGALRISRAFGGTADIPVPLASCPHGFGQEQAALPGFFATVTATSRVAVLRLRDGALLEIEMLGGLQEAAAVVMRDGQVVGTVPEDTRLVMLLASDGSLTSLPTNGHATHAVSEFFAR